MKGMVDYNCYEMKSMILKLGSSKLHNLLRGHGKKRLKSYCPVPVISASSFILIINVSETRVRQIHN